MRKFSLVRLVTLLATALVVATTGSAALAAAPYCAEGQDAEFVFGFAFMKSQLGDTMGDPIECEHANPANGDTLQQTTAGLAFYRKSTNTPTFTDGWNHWAWTVDGLVTWAGARIDPPGVYPPFSVLYTPEQIEHFKRLALYEGLRERQLTRWSEPIKIELLGNYDENDIQSADQIARELNMLIELPVTRVETGGNVFVVIIGADDFYLLWYELTGEFNSELIGQITFYTFWPDDAYSVGLAACLVDYYQSTSTRSEAMEWGIVRGLGFPGTATTNDSKFYSSFRGSLTDLDRAATQILYDPRLTPGMTEADVDAAMAASD